MKGVTTLTAAALLLVAQAVAREGRIALPRPAVQAAWTIEQLEIADKGRRVRTQAPHGCGHDIAWTGIVLDGAATALEGRLVPRGRFHLTMDLRCADVLEPWGQADRWRLIGHWRLVPDRDDPTAGIEGQLLGELEFDPLRSGISWTCVARVAPTEIEGCTRRGRGTFTSDGLQRGQLFLVFS